MNLAWPHETLDSFWHSFRNGQISLRVNQFNADDDIIVRVDPELVISFWVMKVYKIELKDNISDSFFTDWFISEKNTNGRYYLLLQYPFGTRYMAIPIDR